MTGKRVRRITGTGRNDATNTPLSQVQVWVHALEPMYSDTPTTLGHLWEMSLFVVSSSPSTWALDLQTGMVFGSLALLAQVFSKRAPKAHYCGYIII
jgi:hypothetical protein